MDASTTPESKRATTPKHGKKPENRLYSKWRRGMANSQREGDGGMNPDASIRVAIVCGDEVRVYEKTKGAPRRLYGSYSFASHGAARLWAEEHDAMERQARESSAKGADARVYTPFFQVRAAGTVIDHTNSRESAHAWKRAASAKPTELWRIEQGGRAVLLAA